MLIAAMGKAGHGKSTFLKEVQGCMARLRGDYYPGDQRWICFKDPLIDCANKLGWQGVQDEKNRRFLQVLGTDLMRECVDKDYWVNLWRPRVEDALRMGLVVFCDDVRFPNEHAADRQIKSNAINYLSSK